MNRLYKQAVFTLSGICASFKSLVSDFAKFVNQLPCRHRHARLFGYTGDRLIAGNQFRDQELEGGNTLGEEYRNQRKAMNQLVSAVAALLAHVNRLTRGWPRIHRYEYSLSCGAQVCVEFKQFKRAALMTIRWRRPCCCAGREEKQTCAREASAVLEDAEAREVNASHFRFRHEGSLTLDLDNSTTLIFQPGQEVAK
jgi:hypothetical protein